MSFIGLFAVTLKMKLNCTLCKLQYAWCNSKVCILISALTCGTPNVLHAISNLDVLPVVNRCHLLLGCLVSRNCFVCQLRWMRWELKSREIIHGFLLAMDFKCSGCTGYYLLLCIHEKETQNTIVSRRKDLGLQSKLFIDIMKKTETTL